MRDLIEGYFALRHTSALGRYGIFDGLPWHGEDGAAVRKWDGWKLSVYRIEDQIEACVTGPDGRSRTFS
jgi:hypothetical protein